MTNKTSKIGQYLLVNILSTLPPKSLMRFKCVAKWWHALINDPTFVDKHLSHSLLDDQSTRVLLKRMLVPSTEDPNRDKFQSVFSVLTFDNVIVDDDDGVVHKCSTLSGIEDFDVPLAMSLEIGDDQSFHVAGHCNGIICLARPNSTKVYFKGICYWIGSEQQKEFVHFYDAGRQEEEKIRRVIVLFDMSREVFHDILLPHEMLEFNDFEGIGIQMCLKVWNESIALFRLNYNTFEGGDTLPFEMWLMDDDSRGGANNEGGVWTKHFAAKIPWFSMSPLLLQNTSAMWKSNEVLMVEENGGIVCYNLGTKKLKNLPIQSAVRIIPIFPPPPSYFPECKANHSPVVYVKSMVSVTEGNNKYMCT
ncbi:uncharacterized protein [Pyrus communis]|uniref:uncharacterized protein n=1 Tax=Pyrus communis TaxID=23211 RepID=UPI0035C09BF5